MKSRQIILMLMITALAVSCGAGRSNSKGTESKAETSTSANDQQKFTLPEIPTTLPTPEERAKFLVAHYWDNFNFADTTLIHRPEITEQAFVDFLDILNYTTADQVSATEKAMLDKAMRADKVMFDYFTELYEKYLYDPNSPLMNEEMYIPVLEYIVASDKIGEFDKIRPAHQLEMAMKNRVGTKALDLVYTLASGKKEKLSAVKSEYTLLMFYNPDCESCKITKNELENSQIISQNKSRITILAVYPDADISLWRKHLPEMSAEWTVGYDAGEQIRKGQLYDLKAIPTMYLLDRDKKVILKDIPAGRIEQFFAEHQ